MTANDRMKKDETRVRSMISRAKDQIAPISGYGVSRE